MVSNNKSDFKLFMHVIGGHSFVLSDRSNPTILTKSANANETTFYNRLYKLVADKELKDNSVSIFPKFYSTLEKETHKDSYENIVSKFNIWEDTVVHLAKKSILSDVNLENDDEFNDKFNSYIKREIKLLDNEFISEFENLSPSKQNWILFWWIKWSYLFLQGDFVQVEDLTANMIQPIVIDIKLGSQPKKGLKEKSSMRKISETTSKTLGFRLMGSQRLDEQGRLVVTNKYICRKLDENGLKSEFSKCFMVGNKNYNYQSIIDMITQRVKDIRNTIEEIGSKFSFISSSLLIIFDINAFLISEDKNKTLDKFLNVRIIDMGHSEEVENKEINKSVLDALVNFVDMLNEIKTLQSDH